MDPVCRERTHKDAELIASGDGAEGAVMDRVGRGIELERDVGILGVVEEGSYTQPDQLFLLLEALTDRKSVV